MTLPRAWLVMWTAFAALSFVQVGVQVITAGTGRTVGLSHERFLAYLFAGVAILCFANLLYVIAHLRFARDAR